MRIKWCRGGCAEAKQISWLDGSLLNIIYYINLIKADMWARNLLSRKSEVSLVKVRTFCYFPLTKQRCSLSNAFRRLSTSKFTKEIHMRQLQKSLWRMELNDKLIFMQSVFEIHASIKAPGQQTSYLYIYVYLWNTYMNGFQNFFVSLCGKFRADTWPSSVTWEPAAHNRVSGFEPRPCLWLPGCSKCTRQEAASDGLCTCVLASYTRFWFDFGVSGFHLADRGWYRHSENELINRKKLCVAFSNEKKKSVKKFKRCFCTIINLSFNFSMTFLTPPYISEFCRKPKANV